MSQDISANNKRIVKNTLLLYLRMLCIMAVQLYTSRIVLNALGIVDYGIYNAVGGIVTMFAFLNGALVTSTQRYITFELGKGDFARLKQVFTTSVQVHSIISLLVVLLGETIGLWFLCEKMIIPEDRMTAALWVFHLSIFTMVVQIMSVPYNSVIVAHEKMSAFAVISIIEVILKLIIVYLLLICSIDKLIFYSILIAIVQLLIRYVYSIYCNKHFAESKLIYYFNKSLIKEIGTFAGWNLWGNLAATLFSTGLNLLLNVFFGPIVNAARAIAVQVETAIAQFSTNFLMAVNPQITKLYAQGSIKEMHILLVRSSKVTFYLLFALSLPVMIEVDVILQLWLVNVPEYTSIFLILMLCIAIIDSVARPLMTAATATGNVKRYQSVIGGILLSIVPISYCALLIGGNPITVFCVHLIICLIAFGARLYIVHRMIGLSIVSYCNDVLLRCGWVSAISITVALMAKTFIGGNVFYSLFVCFISFFCVVMTSFLWGLSKEERVFVINKIKNNLRVNDNVH